MNKFEPTRSGFFAINISATAAALLSLSLLSILLYILVKGVSYFSFFPTVAVYWEQAYAESKVEFAQQYHGDANATDVTLLLYDPVTQRNQQVTVKQSDISIMQP